MSQILDEKLTFTSMNFKGHVDIEKPRDDVVKYFLDPQYLGEYQPGFIKKELISGKATEEGAISKMYYSHGKREMELTETIQVNRLPDHMEAFYRHKHMDNTMMYKFEVLSENVTRYHYDCQYTRIAWIMPRLMAILFPSLYKKQGHQWMHNFKDFVEKQ